MNNKTEDPQALIDLSGELPLLPLRNAAVFPGAVVSFELGRPRTIAMAEEIANQTTPAIAVFCQKDADVDEPGADDLEPIGTLVRVAGIVKQPTGTYAIVVEGVERVELKEFVRSDPYPHAKVARVAEVEVADDELDALGLSLRDATREVMSLLPGLPREAKGHVESIGRPAQLA